MPRRPSGARRELARIADIRRRASHLPSNARISLGIGDDAALVKTRGKTVLSVDACVEGVHFRRRLLTLQDIGWKSLQSAASDLAAMAAKPVAALAALQLPTEFRDSELGQLTEGQLAAASNLRCPVVGGNLSRGDCLSVTTTVVGDGERFLLRSGARLGDELWLCGQVGLAAAGLNWLTCERRGRSDSDVELCVQAWRRPEAQLDASRRLIKRARAAIDISDGLVGDAEQLAAASGLAVVLQRAALSEKLAGSLVRVASRLRVDPLSFALFGGEDYALLCAGPADRRPASVHCIGYFVAGTGVWLQTERGRRRLRGGFDHFRTQ